jgi:hypothetical protein
MAMRRASILGIDRAQAARGAASPSRAAIAAARVIMLTAMRLELCWKLGDGVKKAA